MNGCPSLIGSGRIPRSYHEGGALVSGFRLMIKTYPNHESVDADQLWENLNTFLVPLSLKLKMLG